ncbi:hypothetical protein [Nocardia sp. NPDC057668]|uniref:hypothetical protein n=1 Tax=Nocardia sp. NPDC057668 TaxID=3346202 RepID=UPI00366C3C6C
MRGALLGVSALLLVGGSFLRLASTDYRSGDYRGWATPWGYGTEGSSTADSAGLLGNLFLFSALLAVIGAALLLLGVGSRTRPRAFVSLATGSVLGTAAVVVLANCLDPLLEPGGDIEVSYGGAFWLCVSIMPPALFVLATVLREPNSGFTVTLDAYGRPRRERATGLDVFTGALLMLYAVLALGGAIWRLFPRSGERMIFARSDADVAVLGVSGVVAFVGGLLMVIAGRAFARRVGAMVAAVVFSASASVVITQVDMNIAYDGSDDALDSVPYLFVTTTVLALIAMVLTVLAAGSAPRYRTPYPSAPPANPYAPPMGGVPYPGVPNGYAAGGPPQGTYLPAAPPGGLGGAPGHFGPGGSPQHGFPPAGTHQAQYTPSLRKPDRVGPDTPR